ncbi:hypothetical protein, partial [Mangrovactinospora gilvigrisea]|uniref:hypothetical protein n=1 Tax=Mangrovactinospora gilvigrisea TaxID=1428644 RepID=UPI000B03CF7F
AGPPPPQPGVPTAAFAVRAVPARHRVVLVTAGFSDGRAPDRPADALAPPAASDAPVVESGLYAAVRRAATVFAGSR